MKWSGVLAAMFVAVAISMIIAAAQTHPNSSSAPAEQRITELLSNVVVPRLELHEVSLEDAVALLNKHAADAGLNHGKPVFLIWKEEDPTPTNFRRLSLKEQADLRAAIAHARTAPSIPGLEDPLPSQDQARAEPAKLSFALQDVPLDTAARYVAGLTDRILEADGERVLLIPPLALLPPLITKEIYLERPEITLEYLFKKLPTTRTDLRPYLEANGVIFTPGCFAHYDPKQAKLVLCFDQNGLDLVDAGLSYPTCSVAPVFDSSWRRWRWRFDVRLEKITDFVKSYSGTSAP